MNQSAQLAVLEAVQTKSCVFCHASAKFGRGGTKNDRDVC